MIQDFVRKRESRWQEYERVQAMPGGAVPEKREEIPREILDNLPADIKHVREGIFLPSFPFTYV